MGDRANIVVDGQYTDPVFLYTHWCGYAVPGILQAALKRGRGRWGDTSYLTRIIFCDLIGDNTEGLTGFGISTRITDNERPSCMCSTIRRVRALWPSAPRTPTASMA